MNKNHRFEKLIYPEVKNLPPVSVSWEIALKLFRGIIWEGNYTHLCEDDWTTESKPKQDSVIGEIIFERSNDVYRILKIGDEGVALLTHYTKTGAISLQSAWKKEGRQGHDKLKKEIQKLFVPTEIKDDGTTTVNFWYDSASRGATKVSRRISVPDWEKISCNYSEKTEKAVLRFVKDFEPSHGGQLILWHGLPGTGKTFAIRALAYEWRRWCDLDYITDPERFFGAAEYMMNVLVEEDEDDYTYGKDKFREDNKDHPLAKDGRWKLLILEDTGELLAEDARDKSGQALSRFLNLTEGIIGQGLKLLILVTTNEPLKTLHPAVARPGRCAGEVEFLTLNEEESKAWMKDNEITLPDTKKTKYTLAELYALKENYIQAEGPTKKALGLGK